MLCYAAVMLPQSHPYHSTVMWPLVVSAHIKLLHTAIYCYNNTPAVLPWCSNSFLDAGPTCLYIWLLPASTVRYSTDS
jgi:hypothetical protein